MRSSRIRLEDIAEAVEGIRGAIEGHNLESFGRDWIVQRAVERGLEIISEASRGLSEQIKTASPEVPWAQIAGIGNVLRHEYHRVEPVIIWNITQTHLRVLTGAIERLLGAEPL